MSDPTYGACFYGYNLPGCFLWLRVLSNGRVHAIADMKFVHTPIESVAKDIKRKNTELGISRLIAIYAVPEMFPKDAKAGHRRTLEAEAPSEQFARFGLGMIPSGGNRQHGWQRVQDFLRDAPDGKPWLLFAPECKWLIRTIPALVQTKTDPEDCEGEEYAANALRAFLASRPQPSSAPKKPTTFPEFTVGWLKRRDSNKARGAMARR